MRYSTRAKLGVSRLSADQHRAFELILEKNGLHTKSAWKWIAEQEEQALSLLFKQIPKTSLSIPITLLSQKQSGSLEAICRYLRDTRALTYAQIGRLLNRDPQTILTSCQRAQKLKLSANDFSVPLAIFADRTLSVMESAVVYLRTELNYKPFQIAELLQRDQRMIATVWQRAIRKRKEVCHE